MTLGERLSMYRKKNGMTQQELGERLSISPQAISKWENDLSEPDISTLKKLSELYQVSVTELLEIEEKPLQQDKPSLSNQEVDDISSRISGAVIGEMNTTPKTLGYCVVCGKIVTEENVAELEPRVLCSQCKAKRVAFEQSNAENKQKAIKLEMDDKEETRRRMRIKRNASIITGLCVGIFLFVFILIGSLDDLGFGIGCGLVLGCMGFAFTAQMFFDGVVRNVLLDLAEKSISFPGLIFSFDIDGIIWLICMKVLFAIIGVLGAILFAILGFIVAFVISPFVYPFSLVAQNKSIKLADEDDF